MTLLFGLGLKYNPGTIVHTRRFFLPKELYLTIITYVQVMGRPSCDREVVAMVAYDALM